MAVTLHVADICWAQRDGESLDFTTLNWVLPQFPCRPDRSKCIQRTTEDLLQVEHGSLYPALHRLQRKGWIAAKWESAGKDLKREFKYYRLTAAGRKQLVAEESRWKKLTGAVARIMWPAQEG